MKRLFKIFVGLVLLLVAVLALLLFFVDKLIRVSVEEAGTYALGVETTLEEAEFGFFSGRLDLDGLAVANPPGFQRASFLELGSAACQVEPTSISSDVIAIPLLELSDLTLDIERSAEGTNYGILLDHMESLDAGGDAGGDTGGETGGGGSETKGEEEGKKEPGTEKKFTIGRIALKNIAVTVNLLPAGGELTSQRLAIESLELHDVGTADNGATPTEIARALITALLEATVEAGNGLVPADLLQDVSARLDGLRAQAETLRADVEDRVQELKDQAEEKADEAVEKVKDKLEKKLGGGLDRLRRGGKDGR